MFDYFSINDLFINLIFPLITSIVPLILTYFLFEPLIGLIKKTWQTLTFNVVYYLRLWEKKKFFSFFCISYSFSFMHSLIFLYISDSECLNWIRQDSSNLLSAFPLALYQAQLSLLRYYRICHTFSSLSSNNLMLLQYLYILRYVTYLISIYNI